MRPYAGFLAWGVGLCKRGRPGKSLLRYEAEEFVDLDAPVVSLELSFFEEEEEELESSVLPLASPLLASPLLVSPLLVSLFVVSPLLVSSDFGDFSPFFP